MGGEPIPRYRRRRFTVFAALAALGSVTALSPGAGLAAREPTALEVRQIVGRTVAYVVCCVDSENAGVYTVRISTASPRWAAADLKILYPGVDPLPAAALLRKGSAGWKVVDVSTGALGCRDDVPERARQDLKLTAYGACLRTGR